MELLKASEADSEDLKKFFEKMILPGAIDLSIRRKGSFFNAYRLLSNDFETLIMKDEQGEIAGTVTLVFRDGFVLGERQKWGYVTDLRIAQSRKAILRWAELFLPALETARDERSCRNIFSAVQNHDHQAYNALIRPTSHGRRKLPRYHLLNRFRLVALHGKYPFSEKPLASIKIQTLTSSTVEELCHYLRARADLRPLASNHSPESFYEELSRWPGLKLDDFRVARDWKGSIVGCAALWDPRNVQEHIPQTYNGFAHTLHQTLWLASFFGRIRPTSQPLKPMPTQMLTHLSCDNGEVFYRLTDEAFSRLRSKDFLTYLHFRWNWRTLPARAYVATSIPYGFYLVRSPFEEAPAWPTPNMDSLPPEFDVAWL